MTVLEKQVAHGALLVFVSQWQHCVNSYQELYGHQGEEPLKDRKPQEYEKQKILRHIF